MIDTIQMDASGRLVLPKAFRERLNLRGGASLRADLVAGRIELTPVADADAPTVGKKGGIAVLRRTGAKVSAAEAVAADRRAQEERGLKR